MPTLSLRWNLYGSGAGCALPHVYWWGRLWFATMRPGYTLWVEKTVPLFYGL